MSKKNCGRIFGREAEAFRRRQIVKDALEPPKKTGSNMRQSIMKLDLTSGRRIKKAVALVSRKQNNGGSSFVEENGHGRHPNQ